MAADDAAVCPSGANPKSSSPQPAADQVLYDANSEAELPLPVLEGLATTETSADQPAPEGESAPEVDPTIARWEQLVRFEMRAPRARGRKEDQIRRQFDLSMPQYFYQLHKAIDSPEINRLMPREVAMLRARRMTRSRFYSPGS